MATPNRSTQGWPPPGLTSSDGDRDNASALRSTPGERWYECDKCGFLFAESDTVLDDKTGLRLCLTGPHDLDKPNSDDVRAAAMSRLFLPEEAT